MLVGIDEDDDHGQLAAGLDQVRGFHTMPSQKSRDGMDSGGGVHIFLAKIVENLQMQWPVAPLVGFVQINSDLNRHSIRHCTRLLPTPAATCRSVPNQRTDPTCRCVPAGSPRGAYPASAESGRKRDCA